MLLRLVAVVVVFGSLPLPRQARAVSNSPFSRPSTSTNAHLSSSPKPQQQPKYSPRSSYIDYPDEYLMYYPQDAAAAYPYYPYAELQPYYPPESSFYPKSYYPFDLTSVPVPAYPYYLDIQSPYTYYPAGASERYPLEDDDRWYDNTANRQSDANADANAAFLRNLIVAQMYNDATNRGRNTASASAPTQNRYGQDIVYGEPVAYARNKDTSNSNGRADFGRYVASRYSDDDDKDVRELKSLIKSKKSEGRASRHFDVNDILEDEYGNSGSSSNDILEDVLGELYYKDDLNEAEQPPRDPWGALLFGDDPLPKSSQNERPVSSSPSTTTPRVPTVTRRAPNREPSTPTPAPVTATSTSHSGQKEEAMLRPGKPAHPQRNSDSVFDTIRHLLTMDRALSQQNEPDVVPALHKRQPQKRYVMSEKSLTEELNALKKNSA